MANPFDQFDGTNPFDEFDSAPVDFAGVRAGVAQGPAPTIDPAWYERLATGLSRGAGHRMSVLQQGAVRADTAPNADGSLPSWQARQAEALARAQAGTAAYDRANPAPAGLVGAIGYGVGEAPETLAFPAARVLNGAGLWKGLANAILNGAGQGAYGAGVNDRDVSQGAIGGAAAGGAMGALGQVGGKVIGAARNQWADAGAQALDRTATENGVTLGVSDLNPASMFTELLRAGRYIPGSGAAAKYQRQAQGLANWNQRIEDSLRTPELDARLAGATHEQIIADSAKAQLAGNRGTAGAMFEATPQDVVVEPVNLRPALFELSRNFPEALDAVGMPAPVTARLRQIVDPPRMEPTPEDMQFVEAFGGLQNLTPDRVALIERSLPGFTERASGAPAPVPPITAQEAHWMQSALGEAQRMAETQVAMGNRNGGAARFITDARNALLQDMDAVTNGEFANARGYFRENVVPFREEPLLRGLVDDGATAGQGIFNRIGPDAPLSAELLMRNLTPEGQAAVQHGLYTRAGNKAVTDSLQSGVSPSKLARAFDIGEELAQNRSMAKVFTPEQQAMIAPFRDVANVARDAGTWAHTPPTGVRNVLLNAIIALKSGAAPTVAGGLGVTSLGPFGALAAAIPSLAARAGNALDSSEIFKRLYMAQGGTQADPILQALLAQAAAGGAEPDYGLLGMLGQ